MPTTTKNFCNFWTIIFKFGGGGHKNASGIGFGLEKSVEEIETLLENEIVEFLKNQPKEKS